MLVPEVFSVIVKEYKIGNTTIKIADDAIKKNEAQTILSRIMALVFKRKRIKPEEKCV